MANKHMKRCSTWLAVREMRIKTTVRSHCTPTRMANIRKTENSKCWQGCGEIGTLVHCWREYEMVQPLWKIVWHFLKRLNIELSYDSAFPFLGNYSKELKAGTCTNIYTPMFTAALFTIAKRWKQPKCPWVDKWINKMWSIYTMQ